MSIFEYTMWRGRRTLIVRAIFWLGLGWRGKAFASVCGIIGVLFVASVLVPYEPYDPKRLEVVPEASCPEYEVGILTTRAWQETWYQNIDSVRAAAQWRDVDTGAYYPAFNGPTVPNWSKPVGTVKADILMPTPRTPGEYRLHLQYDVEGGVLLAPRHQEIPPDPSKWLKSTNTLTVEECE